MRCLNNRLSNISFEQSAHPPGESSFRHYSRNSVTRTKTMMFDFSLLGTWLSPWLKKHVGNARREKLFERLGPRTGGNEEIILALFSSAGVTLLPLSSTAPLVQRFRLSEA